MVRRYGDLPSDLDDQDVSMPPPPQWFRPTGLLFPYFSGFGERREDREVNPLEYLQNLKFKQEMPKSIPAVASRYTDIEPLSPLFRSDRAKYGFGQISDMVSAIDNKSAIKLFTTIVIIWLLFSK